MNVRSELLSLAEPDYQKFSASLLPGVDNILGVRIPKLRIIAKKYFRFGVFNHSTAKENFILETIVNFAVVIHGLRGEKSNIRVEITNHIFGISSD